MLFLNRMIKQSIIIGHDIRIKIGSIHGKQVCIGIDAPKHISVHREEIYQKINRARQAANDCILPKKERVAP